MGEVVGRAADHQDRRYRKRIASLDNRLIDGCFRGSFVSLSGLVVLGLLGAEGELDVGEMADL